LYSAVFASNPNLPFINVFKDPGNPPLFFILLRLWFEIFGWTEATGRLLCVLIGLTGIITLYCFVKSLCGKKYAFVSSFLLTISYSSIGYSHEMRAYILEIALVSIAAQRFIMLLHNQNIKNTVFYIIISSLLVNTHYFGILLTMGNLIFYFINSQKTLNKIKIIYFILTNIIIALSLIPYFIITAFQEALLDNNFNSWIPTLGREYIFLFVLLPILYSIYRIFRKYIKKFQLLHNNQILLLDYTIFVSIIIYILAFLISLKRPILVSRYLSIYLPFISAVLPVIIFNAIISNVTVFINSKYYKINMICFYIILTFLSNFINTFEFFGGGFSDFHKERQQFIITDVRHHNISASQIYDDINYNMFYKLTTLPDYSESNKYKIVYIYLLHKNIEDMLLENNLNTDNMLKIQINNRSYVFKKFLEDE
jgi:uncharacterized membrane protein